MKKNILNLLFPVILILSSCSVSKSTIQIQESKRPDINATSTNVLIRPIVADLDISSERKTILYRADLNLPASEIRANAIKLFLQTYNYDYIIDGQFVRKDEIIGGELNKVEYTLTVFGAT
jgi:hypothetical protein